MRAISFVKLTAALAATVLLIGLQSPAQAAVGYNWDPGVTGGTAVGGTGT